MTGRLADKREGTEEVSIATRTYTNLYDDAVHAVQVIEAAGVPHADIRRIGQASKGSIHE